MSTPIRFRVFDIEIAKTVEEVGGWDAARSGKAGFSCATMFDSEVNHTWVFGPKDLDALVEALEEPCVVISYNGLGFDVPAIEGMIGRKLNIATHFDLLDVLVTTVGNRKGLTLDNVAQRTLGRGKTGSGAMAPLMYKDGLMGGEEGVQQIVNLLRYCAMDVIVLRDLIEFLQKNGFVSGPNGLIQPTLPPYFAQLATTWNH